MGRQVLQEALEQEAAGRGGIEAVTPQHLRPPRLAQVATHRHPPHTTATAAANATAAAAAAAAVAAPRPLDKL